jgi:hypothetical protein
MLSYGQHSSMKKCYMVNIVCFPPHKTSLSKISKTLVALALWMCHSYRCDRYSCHPPRHHYLLAIFSNLTLWWFPKPCIHLIASNNPISSSFESPKNTVIKNRDRKLKFDIRISCDLIKILNSISDLNMQQY